MEQCFIGATNFFSEGKAQDYGTTAALSAFALLAVSIDRSI
jgi:hypothetical protein